MLSDYLPILVMFLVALFIFFARRVSGGGGGSIITPEIEGEFQLPGRPLSFVGTFRGTFLGGGAGVYTALAGIRFNFGGGDLIDQVAPMDTLPVEF